MKEIDLTEFNKLEVMLKAAGIEYKRVIDSEQFGGFYQLRDFRGEEERWDVVIHKYSYGAAEGLLELMDDEEDVIGYLNAEECFEVIKTIEKRYE